VITFRVLGPLVAEDARGPVDLKGPRHRAVLARLLVARGRVVPVDRLVDDLWEDPPDGAVGAVQTFVAALRKALEPDRAPRAPARLIVTAAPGYALRAEAVDAWQCETAVITAGTLLDGQDAAAALAEVEESLGLWRGPAYAEFADQPWARGEIARLDELRLLATERRGTALLALGRAAEAVPDLEVHVDAHPWREEGWRLLALARYQAGRQGDALDTLRRARHVLAAELGLDPGPALRTLEADILAQAPSLTASSRAAAVPAGRSPVAGDGPAADPASPGPPASSGLVGRQAEWAVLDGAAAAVIAAGAPGLVLVAGEAGGGKTALAEAFARHLAARGWATAWGSNPDDDGLPAAWPWTQVLTALPGVAPAPDLAADPAVARFHWHRAVAGHLARHAPLLVVLDDLHRAGEETLALLASVVTDPAPGAVLVLATYRTTDVPARLAGLLGRVARAEPLRVYLGGLPREDVAALVRATTGREVGPATARLLHRRSGGNPFFVRELARLLDTDTDLSAVPAGVRDVVRHRLATLPEPVRSVLLRAAVLGPDVDLDLLPAGDVPGDAGDVLDAAEAAADRGFLVEYGPGRFRFAHALVRDTLYQDLSRSRRARWHARIAAAIEERRPDDVEALAHHFPLAGDAPKAVRYARAAAERAERRFAPHEAARLWRVALDQAGDAPGERLDLVMGLVRALAVTGALADARRLRAEALTLATALDEPARTARVLAAFDVPAIWTENDDPELAQRVVAVAEHALAALPPHEKALRSRLLSTVALELRATGGDRARAAAREAEALARELDDPAVLAFALNARFMQSFERAGLAPERVRIGAELVDLAARHALVTFEVLGHLILVQAHAALADLTAADRHAEAADRLGDRYEIPLVGVFTDWYRALRASLRGEPAEAAYRAAAARLPDSGMTGVDDGILGLALLCDRLQRGAPPLPDVFGGYEDWCRPLVLLAEGRAEEARRRVVPPAPRDLLYEARTCLHALTALALDDRPAMTRLHTDLLPAADELAGAGSGMLTLRPVAHYLAELATALGHGTEAAGHRRQALAVATRAGTPVPG
jgi:DNA-binding SARP family transcriptional activator